MKNLRKLCFMFLTGSLLVLGFSMPAAAKDYLYFDFNYVYEPWNGGNTSCFCTKWNTSPGIVNTSASNSGFVTGNRAFNAQIVRSTDMKRFGISSVNGMARVSVIYKVNGHTMTDSEINDQLYGQQMYLGVSTIATYSSPTKIKGSWAADTY